MANGNGSNGAAPLHGTTLALATVALSLATFMNVLDTSIANVSIPAMAGDLGVSPDQGTWVITSFGVANAVSLPLTGWLTQRYGQVRLFVASVLLFVIASFLCGLASTLPLLILFRVLQGAVAGPMIPLSQSLLLSSYPKSKAGSALAIWSITTLVAPVVGPVLGGWITDNVSWPWIFYINVPVGLAAAFVTWSVYRHRETATVKRPIDRIGLALLVVWVGALQIMLDKGKDLDWFGSPQIVALAATAVVGFALFLVWELTEAKPIVDLRLFKGRNFMGGTVAISIAYAVFFANLVILPTWIQEYLGYRAVDAGLVTAPLGIFAVILAPVMGKIMPKSDMRVLATLAFLGFAGVFLMRSWYTTDIDAYTLVLPTLLQGIPVALFFTPLTAIVLSGLPPEKIPAAAGLSNFARIFAGAAGTSLQSTIWNDRTIQHHSQLAEQTSVNNPAYVHALAGIQTTLHASLFKAEVLFETQLGAQAAMLGLNDVFWLSAVIFIVIIPLIWITKPSKDGAKNAAGAGGH